MCATTCRANNRSVPFFHKKLTEAPDDATRFRLIVDTIDALEQQRPSGSDIALRADVRESELRLQREIAELRADVQKDIAELRAEVQQDIAKLRAEVQKDIAELQNAMGELRADVDRDVAQLQASIERTKTDLLKWIVPLMLGQVGALAALVKLL